MSELDFRTNYFYDVISMVYKSHVVNYNNYYLLELYQPKFESSV